MQTGSDSFYPFASPWAPFSDPTPSQLAQLSSTQTPIPALVELLAFRAPSLLSGSQMTPEGLLAKVCSLDFVFSPRLLCPPRASWLWPQRQPLSVPANTSQLCVQTKPCIAVGAGPTEGTFPGNSGGGGWGGRGDCLIAGTRRHRLGDLAGSQGPVAVGGDWRGGQAGRNLLFEKCRKRSAERDNTAPALCVCVRLRLRARVAGASRSEAVSSEIFVLGCESDLWSPRQGSGPGRGDMWSSLPSPSGCVPLHVPAPPTPTRE